MYSLGYDLGSSSIKLALTEHKTGSVIKLMSYPNTEMAILAPKEGWAEQDPNTWWKYFCEATQKLLQQTEINPRDIKSIGIAYQMHGLVMLDKNLSVLRNSIIWCDSRAVQIGDKALSDLGQEYCYNNLLNSPGNFTASKLKWVKENEPELFEKIDKVMLPGDYIAFKLSGELSTTVSGLSEGMLWDFKNHKVATTLLDYYGFDQNLIPKVVDTFGIQGKVNTKAAEETGLTAGTVISYRAGDQPNNAMSLQVLNPGEIAATGGTSGVVYGVTDKIAADKKSRVNAFAHVNHSPSQTRIGQLLCINGAGSQYAWIRQQIGLADESYTEMENKISEIPVGSEGLRILPFGNGAERMLNNIRTGAQFSNVQFNIHTRSHFFRAALEGIAFSFVYGIKAMHDLGVYPNNIKVGNDNLFQSETFAQTICNLLNCNIEMMNTTGAIGAAKASRVGLGDFNSAEDAIDSTETIKTYKPINTNGEYNDAFENWEKTLDLILNQKKTESE